MRKAFLKSLVLLAIFSGLILASCSNPLLNSSATQEENGPVIDVTFQIPPVSPYILMAIQAAGEKRSEDAASRGYFFSDTANFRLYDENGTLIDSGSDPFNNDFDASLSFSFFSVPPGGGYYIEVDLINSYVSATIPVVSGTSAPFSVGPDGTSVEICPTPVNPVLIDIGATESISLSSAVYDFVAWQFTALGGEAWYKIVPSDTGDVHFVVTPDSTASAFIALYDENGDFIASAVGSDASFISNLTAGNTYYVGIFLLADSPVTHTAVFTCNEYAPPPSDIYEPDDTYLAASSIISGETQTRSFHVNGDEDWVAFNATAGMTYEIITSSAGGVDVDTELTVYDTDGVAQLAYNDDYLGLYSRISWDCLTDGTYFVKVTELSDNTGDYNLSMDESETPPPPPPITYVVDSGWLDGNLDAGGSVWYSVTVTGGNSYDIYWDDNWEGSGTMEADLMVTAYQEDMTTEYFTGDSGYFTPWNITVPVGESTVYIKIAGYSGYDSGTFGIKVDSAP